MSAVLGTSVIDPLTLSPALWLDASDATTLLGSAGTPVAADREIYQWSDKSTNGRHATQALAGKFPIRKVAASNGRDTVYFDGNDFLATPSNKAAKWFTVIMVMRLMPSSPLAQVFSWSGTYISLRIDSNVLYSSRNPDDPYTYNNPGVCRVNGVATLTYPASSYHVVSVSKDISAYDAYPAIIGGYLPSAGRYVTGYYAEVIAFDKLISAADLRRIEFYLGKKYAIKLN